MSRDDWIAIIKTRKKFVGHNCSASLVYHTLKEIRKSPKEFTANTIEEAIHEAQKIPSEYGYRFVNLPKKKKA